MYNLYIYIRSIYTSWLPYIFSLSHISKSAPRDFSIHRKKRLAIFPSQAGMSLTKLFLAGNN